MKIEKTNVSNILKDIGFEYDTLGHSYCEKEYNNFKYCIMFGFIPNTYNLEIVNRVKKHNSYFDFDSDEQLIEWLQSTFKYYFRKKKIDKMLENE